MVKVAISFRESPEWKRERGRGREAEASGALVESGFQEMKTLILRWFGVPGFASVDIIFVF